MEVSAPEEFGAAVAKLRDAIGQVIVGQDTVVEEVLMCLFAGGHVLLEGAPGLGKTLLVRSLSKALKLDFSRIQFTPDLMPTDIVGTQIIMGSGDNRRFELQRGPVFAQILLADEINRATPKTQSALLEAMGEQSVTIAGETHRLDDPFFVLATENPLEMEGTYPLPEAQLDRFLFKVMVPTPDENTLVEILTRTTQNLKPEVPEVLTSGEVIRFRQMVRSVRCAEPMTRYAARIVQACDPDQSEEARLRLRHGPGVRGAQALILAAKVWALAAGRTHVAASDLQRVTLPALRHRVIRSFEAEAEGRSADSIVVELARSVPEMSEGARAIQ